MKMLLKAFSMYLGYDINKDVNFGMLITLVGSEGRIEY